MQTNDKKKVRIAHIVGGLTTGGVEAVIYNYCSRLNPESYEFVYISYDPPAKEAAEKFKEIGFSIYSVTKKRENFFKSCKEVYSIIKRHNINIIHSHMTVMSFVTSIIGWICGVKVRIAHSHLAESNGIIKKALYSILKILTKISSTHYFACGADAAKYLFGKKAYEENKVKIVKNAIDIDKYKYNELISKKIKADYKINERLCIGHVGRFTQQKNHKYLIEVFEKILGIRNDVVLMLVGDGPEYDNIKLLSQEKNILDKIIFTGSVKEIYNLYQAMDLLIMPSFFEGLPVVLIEAQANGLPAFVADTITKEVQLTEMIEYLPISKNPKEWANKVLSLNGYCRYEISDEIIKCGYSIEFEVIKLNEFYIISLNGRQREEF